MPVHKVAGGWRWGTHGKVYKNRVGAERQARAIYASGYREGASDAMPKVRTGSREHVGKPIRPSLGDQVEYRRKMNALIDRMCDEMLVLVRRAYSTPVETLVAQDKAVGAIDALLREFARKWMKRFDEGAPKLAEWFANRAGDRSDRQLRKILREAGISAPFRATRAMQQAQAAIVKENVSLIRSIPQQYLTQVEGIVMRGVSAGRDLGSVSKELQEHFGVTKRRAGLIARDQGNKATHQLARVRQLELGITEAIWQHSAGGKKPRSSHVKAGREKARYKIAEGWYDPHVKEHILPGQLINCRCTSRPIIPGLEDVD